MTALQARVSGETFDNCAALIVGGKATTAVETVSTGQAAHLSFDLSQRLRVILDSGSIGGGSTGSAVPSTGLATYPLANAQDTVILVSSATLAASGAWTHSSVVAVGGYRKINIDLYYTTDSTGGTGGYPGLIPVFSNKAGTAPAAGDDVWVAPTILNDTRTLTTPSGTIATGTDWTQAPGFAYGVGERLLLRLVASANDTDIQRARFVLDCSTAKYFCCQYAEVGDTSNPGALAIEISLAI